MIGVYGKLLNTNISQHGHYFFQDILMLTRNLESIYGGLLLKMNPIGNNGSWESMHFTPEEMTDFVKNYLGPQLEKDGKGDKIILGL